jgi:PAS domain S-box-containing protein
MRTQLQDAEDAARILPTDMSFGPELGKVQEAFERSEVDLDAILRAVRSGITVQRPDGSLWYANDAAAGLLGYASAKELVAAKTSAVTAKFDIVGEDGRPVPLDRLPSRRALKGEDPPEEVMRFRVIATGVEQWSRVKSTPVIDRYGKIQCVVNVFSDVTAVKRGELGQEFLMKAGSLLNSSLEFQKTIQRVAELAVPQLADWCGVDLLSKDRKGLERLAVAHADPEKIRLAQEVVRKYPPDLSADTGEVKVMRTGKSELYPVITPDMIEATAKDADHLRLLKAIGFRSVMIVPLCSRGVSLGAIVFVNSETSRSFDTQDLGVAEELGRLAGLAMENARLYEESKNAAEELRLLTEAIPHMVWTASSDGSPDYYNQSWFSYTGLSEKESSGTGWLSAVYPEDAAAAEAAWKGALKEGHKFEVEYRIRRASDGEFRWHLSRGVPLRDDDGSIVKWFGTCTDIHDQKMTEEKVRRQAYFDNLTGLPNRDLL